MKILTFTTLFPNSAQPNLGGFVETRLRHLIASNEIESIVIAPVPWFPFRHKRFGHYSAFAKAPREAFRYGTRIFHPRYPLLPKVSMTAAPFLLAASAVPTVKRIIDSGYDFDLIDAHYFYPDGVAAAILGRRFKKPVVITARGTDISFIPKYRLPRKMIQWAAQQSSGVISVCNALKTAMIDLGVEASHIVTLRNGVDLQLFRPVDRDKKRKELGLNSFTLLSAGNLIPLKGHDLIIAALPSLPDVRLLIAGAGPEREKLEAYARKMKVANRVSFLGLLSQTELSTYFGAVDSLVLASSREGWANVLLESMACGTPVIASNVWGTPEVVASPEAGILMSERSPTGVADAVRALRANYPNRDDTRRYAERFSWNATTRGQLELFRSIIKGRQ